MNSDPKPSTQIPAGKDRHALGAESLDRAPSESGGFIGKATLGAARELVELPAGFFAACHTSFMGE